MLDLVASRTCLGCAASTAGAPLCPDCAPEAEGRLRPIPTRRTLFASAWSIGDYAGPVGALVRHCKFGHDMRAAEVLEASLGRALEAGLPATVSTVVAVPTTPWRLLWRGFHLPERLAAVVSARLGAPVAASLRRRWSLAQAGRSFEARVDAGSRLFEARGAVAGHVLLVDDVLTSGASLHGAAAELLAAGATSVSCLVLAAAGPLRRVPVGIL